MRCEQCDALLWPFAAGELSDEETGKVEAHIAQCTSCEQRLAEVRQVAATVEQLPSVGPSASLCLETKEAVRLELERRGRVRRAFGPVMDADDMAVYLKVDVELIYRHLDEIPHFELEGQIRFRRERVDAWIESSERARAVLGPVVRAVS